MSGSPGRWVAVILAAAVLASGTAATWVWLHHVPEAAPPPLAVAALLFTAGIACANIALRWLRWHYLTRRIGLSLTTRDSLALYVGTLPAILTPLYVGELIRPVIIGKRYPGHRGDLVRIWLLERSSDLLAVALLVTAADRAGWELGLAVAVWGTVLLGVRATRKALGGGAVLTVLILSTTAWVLPGLALWMVLSLLAEPVPVSTALAVFARGTLFGSLTGLPGGVTIAGSSMIVQLQEAAVGLPGAVSSILVFRAGTAWFAVALGVLFAVLWRRTILDLWRGAPEVGHFEQLAERYADELPRHVRDRLLHRKVDAMLRRVDPVAARRRMRALDVGCGHGWYAAELASRGLAVTGVEPSAAQMRKAREHVAERGERVLLIRAAAGRLPFAGNQFDYAYAINVMHHLVDPATRDRALAEVVRVLKPGGVFFLHEMNTANPVFRLYMGYVYPLVRSIDEGTERWLPMDRLPSVKGARWLADVDCLTFLPDFVPKPLLPVLEPLERALERSRLRKMSAHYQARLVKDEATSGSEAEAKARRL